jgi:hypothetical protein
VLEKSGGRPHGMGDDRDNRDDHEESKQSDVVIVVAVVMLVNVRIFNLQSS